MQSMDARKNSIIEGVIWKQLLVFFLPILLGTFFQQLYNTVDAIVVGNFVGKQALAAVGGTTGTVINLIVGFFVGLTSGATVIISQQYGARQHEMVSRTVHTGFALSVTGGAALTVGGILFAPDMLKAIGTPADVLEPATRYMRIYFAGTIPSLLFNMGSSILRAVGDSKRPLYFLIVSCLVNTVLDLLLVAVFHMGVEGAALATIFSQVVSAVLVLRLMRKTGDCYRLDLRRMRLDLSLTQSILRIGLPTGLQSAMYSISNLFIQSTVNGFGTDTMAAWTALGKIDGLNWMVMGAFGISITTFVGQNFGARQLHRIKRGIGVCSGMAMGFSLLFGVILYFWGEHVFRLFTSDAAVIANGVVQLKTLCLFYFTYPLIEVLSGAMRGVGDTLIPMLITCFGVCAFRAVWVFAVVPFAPQMTTVVYSYPLSWALTSVLFVLYYFKSKWLTRRI